MRFAFPFFVTIALTLIFAWIFIFAGIAQIVYAYLQENRISNAPDFT
ncbi:DUF308 domain-containing protein [Nostoc sp.]